ncbi:MAG: hypothetical protein ABEL76_09490, partial [Bradymonadaceae bacterium]
MTLRNQYLLLQGGRARFHGGRIRADWAWFDMFEVAYGGSGRVIGVDPAGVLRDLGTSAPWMAGELTGDFRAHGAVPMGGDYELGDPYPTLTDARRELIDFEATSDWTFEPAGALPGPIGRVTLEKGARVRADYEVVSVPRARLRAPGASLRIDHLSMDYRQMEFWRAGEGPPVDLHLSLADVAPFVAAAGFPGLSGRLSASLTASGPLAAPRAEFRARVDEPVWRIGDRSIQGEQIRLEAHATSGRVTVEPFEVQTDRGSLSVEGDLTFGRSDGSGFRSVDRMPVDMRYRAAGLELSIIDQLLGT